MWPPYSIFVVSNEKDWRWVTLLWCQLFLCDVTSYFLSILSLMPFDHSDHHLNCQSVKWSPMTFPAFSYILSVSVFPALPVSTQSAGSKTKRIHIALPNYTNIIQTSQISRCRWVNDYQRNVYINLFFPNLAPTYMSTTKIILNWHSWGPLKRWKMWNLPF